MLPVRWRFEGVLQGLEAGGVVVGQYDDFAVDPRSRHLQLAQRLDQVRHLAAQSWPLRV